MERIAEEVNIPKKKTKYFCAKTFRRELKTSEAFKSLKLFISAAQNNGECDAVVEYMESGGSIMEMLSLIDSTAKGDLTTALPVFDAVQLILLRFQSPDSEYNKHCLEGAKKILRVHMEVIHLLLSMNVDKHKKVALKLLTAIVTLNLSFASEVLNLFSPSLKMTEDLLSASPDKDSVRKYYILFILSFLVEGNQTILRTLMDNKGFLSAIIPGLKYDDPETVNMTLTLMKEKILMNIKISKTLKLKVFNTQVIKSLFELYNWKGPQSLKQYLPGTKKKHKIVEVKEKDKALVVESVHSILLILCTSKKYGVAFQDRTLGISDATNNQLLLTVFEGLSNPLSNDKISEIVLKTLLSCPDLVKPILHKLEPHFHPRSSMNWFAAINFAENLIKGIDAIDMLKSSSVSTPKCQAFKIAKTFCMPISLLRIARLGAQKSQTLDVRMHSLELYSIMWEATRAFTIYFGKTEQGLKKSVEEYFSTHLIELEDLLELWHVLCKKKDIADALNAKMRVSYLTIVLKSLEMTVACQFDTMRSLASLACDLMRYLDEIKETMDANSFVSIQSKIVQLMEVDIRTLSPDTELFKTSLLICLQSPLASSMTCASKILWNLDIFHHCKSEVDIWLTSFASLPPEQSNVVAEYLVKSVCACSKSYVENFCGSDKLSALIFKCAETLKECYVNDSENANFFRLYLNDVLLRLQHYHPVASVFHDRFKSMKKILGKPLLEYLNNWTNNSLSPSGLDLILCPIERDVFSWLLDDQDSRHIDGILNQELHTFKLYQMFHTAMGLLIARTKNNTLTTKQSRKFLEALTRLISFDASFDFDYEENCLIPFVSNESSVFSKKIVEYVFCNDILLNAFDVFPGRKNSSYNCTKIIVKIFMINEIVKKATKTWAPIQNWKLKFIKELIEKFKNGYMIQADEHFECVLDFFQYQLSDVSDVLDTLISNTDLKLFLDNDKPSMCAVVLVKFIDLYSKQKLLNEKVLKLLCDLIKYYTNMGVHNFEILDNCLVTLLRENPQHLLLIGNDFLEVLLQRRSVTTVTIRLGQLLLNDPAKVTDFLSIALNHLDSELVISMLSVLLTKVDVFGDVTLPKDVFPAWKACDISKEKTPNLFLLLENLYEKYEKNILHAMKGEDESFISKGLPVLHNLVRLFMDKNIFKLLKKNVKKGKFNPELCLEVLKKCKTETMIEYYMKGLIIMFSEIVKNSNDMTENVWIKYSSIVREVVRLETETKWESIANATEWKDFFKLALGACLKTSKHPFLLKILRMIITTVYQPKENNKTTSFFFQILISHSQFLNLMLRNTPLKKELVDLFLCLVERSTSDMSTKHIPILLASYSATMSPSDQVLLRILDFYEREGFKFNDYEPLIWGETAVSHYSIGHTAGLSLWQRFSMTNVLDLLDSQKIETSLNEFPIYRRLNLGGVNEYQIFQTEAVAADISDIYDPAFLLPLFVNLLSPGALVFPLPFIYKGALAYTIRGLSSECKDVRMAASVVLNRFYSHIELSQNLKQKLIWMHFINCFRFGIEDLSAQPLSNIVTLFFARMTLELSKQPAEMHVPLQSFLLAKSYFAFNLIPEFLPLFHSSQVNFSKHKEWLLNILKYGTRTDEDVKVIFYSMALKVIFCFFSSPLCNLEIKELVLQVLERLIAVKKSKLLIKEYGLLSWINTIEEGTYPALLSSIVPLLSRCTEVIVRDLGRKNYSSDIVQVLNILMKILPSVKVVGSVDVFHNYLNTLYSCLVSFIDGEKIEWFNINRHKIEDIIDTGKYILGRNTENVRCIPFYFGEWEGESMNDIYYCLKKTVFLFHFLTVSLK